LFGPSAKGRGGTLKQPARYLASGTLNKKLTLALVALKLDPDLTWYQATRHTFASQYMMAGGDLGKLRNELGHSDIKTTMRYAKLSPNYRTEADRALLQLPQSSPNAQSAGRSTIGSSAVFGAIGSKIGSSEPKTGVGQSKNILN
jgi:hypothetical protein